MAKDLLFEIGAEEIPAGFMPNILGQLKQLAETKLNDAHLPFESIATYGTPRRLALIVKGLADTSAEISERHKVLLHPSPMMLMAMQQKQLSALLVVKVLM